MSHHGMSNDIDLPQFNLDYILIDEKRCFKSCVKNFDNPYLEVDQETCLINCINKYKGAQMFLSGKMQALLVQLVEQDPKLKQAFAEQK